MKTKKILTMITSVALALTLGAGSLAGCNGNKHQHAYNWVIDREATCTEQGYRTGTCVCGDVKGEFIPIDPNAHVFDEDWDIKVYPTENSEGRAEKTCQNDSSHTVVAILPAITAAGTGYYSSDVTVKPTIISEGNRHFVFAHEAGEVEFDVVLPKREKIENIEDVIIYASSLHNNIRSNKGDYVYGDPDGTEVKAHEFSNYYGNNYTRVSDGGNNRDFWYSLDENGNPYGVSAVVETVVTNEPEDPENPPEGWKPEFAEIARDPVIDESVTEYDLLGYGYSSGGGMRETYGAEDTLLAYYEASQSESAVKYTSDFNKAADESYSGWFEYSRKETTHFCRYRIEFTTFPTGEIKTLNVRTKIIRTFMLANTFNGSNYNNTEIIYGSDGDIIFSEIYPISGDTGAEIYQTAIGADGKEYIVTSGVKEKPDGTPLLDKNGNQITRPLPPDWREGDTREYYYEADATHPTDHPYIATRTINFTQVLKTPDDVVEENKFSSESRFIRSFSVTYDGRVINENEVVEVTAGEFITFGITDIQPSETAKLDYDPLSVFIKTASGEIELNYTGDIDSGDEPDDSDFNQNAYHIVGHFNRTNGTVFVCAQYKGNLTLILRTRGGKSEREINLNFKAGNPSAFTAQAYLYSDANGVETHTWTTHDYDNDNDIITLYAGQSLYVRALPLASEANFVDDRFVTSVPNVYGGYITTEDNLTLEDGTKVSKITAVAPTTELFDPVAEFNLNSVNTRPSTSRPGEVEPVASARIRIKIVEAPSVSDLFTGTYTGRFSRIRIVETGNLVSADVTATFTENTINIRVTDGTNVASCVYNYSYNPETHELSCTWASGKENTGTFDFDIRLNEAFKISITHTTYENRSETIVLTKQGN